MSLARLALRLATVEALRPSALLVGDGPWPTIAARHVYDSKIDPIEDLKPDQSRPIVCVYTDDDDGRSGQGGAGGPPFLTTVDLVFETSVVVRVPDAADPSAYVLGEPATDPELEASLDMLGAQIAFALLYGPTGDIFRKVCGSRVINPRSAVHRTSEEGVRLARRVITWKIEIKGEQYVAAPAEPLTGLDRLPTPLRQVAEALPAGSYGRAIINGLIGEPTAPVMPTAVPLQTVGLDVAVAPPGGQPPQTPNIIGEVDDLNS